jgi:cell division protease FtsH
MTVLLGGRAAELTVFGHLSTGAADDLRRVTDIAHSMVTRYGMSERLGGVAYDREPQSFLTGPALPSPHREESYAEETVALIDHEVRDIVDSAMNRALDILRQRRDILERAARKLLEKETLDDRDLAELIGPTSGSPVQVAAE